MLRQTTALKCIDRLIHAHLLDLLDREMEFLSSINESDAQKKAQMEQFFGEHEEFPTLMDTVKTLKCAEAVARKYRGDEDEVSTNIGARQSNVHKRTYSTPPALLSIDEPIEEETSSGMWYMGNRRSPSPPALGESSVLIPLNAGATKLILFIGCAIATPTVCTKWYLQDASVHHKQLHQTNIYQQ